jgi:hypothetical protein
MFQIQVSSVWLLAGVFINCVAVEAARVSIVVPRNSSACSEVRLPRAWTPPPVAPMPDDYRRYAQGTLDTFGHFELSGLNLDFFNGAGSDRILLGGHAFTVFPIRTKVEKIRTESLDRWVIQLKPGRARVATAGQSEWSTADPIPQLYLSGDGTYTKTVLGESAAYSYKGHDLKKSGTHWEDALHGPVRLSGDGKYIAILSFTGDLRLTRERAIFNTNQFWGQAYVDIFEADSGTLAFAFHLDLRGAPHELRLPQSFWLGAYYFVLPLGPDALDGENAPPSWLFCDMRKVKGSAK